FETVVGAVNPYCVGFAIDNQPVGDYFIEASNNDGLNWGRLDNGQHLRILAAPKGLQQDYDPLVLGVSWASHFNWQNRYTVPLDTTRDITAEVQTLIEKAAKAKGGGVVYFPAGKYHISKLLLRENVVLLGESKQKTVLLYNGTDKDFITCAGSSIAKGHIGVARMRITVPKNGVARPDVFINLGQAAVWQAVTNIHERTATEMFVVDVRIDYDFTETKRDRRGLPISSIGRERLYVAGCEFVGFHMESHNYVSEYVTVRDNYAEFGMGVFIYTGDYLFLENNEIVGHTEINREKHGFMIRANSYLYNNTVSHTGSDPGPGNDNFNDGEAICNETPGAAHNYGYISHASPNSITAGYTFGPFVQPKVEIFNHRTVMIVHGRGLGQYRRVKTINEASREIVVEKNWDVVPDTTSRFTLIEPNENIVYYKNTIIDNPKGYWLFGNSIDCVVADNVSIDCDGVFLWSCIYTNDENPQYYFEPNYFNRIIRNSISGVSRKSRRSGIGMNSTREGRTNGRYIGVIHFGNEIRDNYITGIPGETPLAEVTEAPAVSGIFVYATVHSSLYDGKDVAGDATNQIIEGNVLRNLKAGINLSRCVYGQVIRDNESDATVGLLINDSTGSQNTLVVPAVP
ncbi:MAG TPA: glycosyl hydrolase family 28-related protein, partial [Chryseolinea sp.]|nr:glycosyl hydrolase family 28-related protein [Chryseolinea sp.]